MMQGQLRSSFRQRALARLPHRA
ncbi:MAG: type II secretion system protein GspG, partial [Ralstonia sp.]|nr:type II secretion system protein GspG [Ralstonia sp.]MBA4298246.1 type II secretion system protein GspG [Ralstonia sp.]